MMKMTVSGKKAVLEDGTIRWRFPSGWYTKITTNPSTKVPDAEAKELEAAYQAAISGKKPEWDYLEYLNEVERAESRGRPYPAGNIEPPDAFHETGAAGLG